MSGHDDWILNIFTFLQDSLMCSFFLFWIFQNRELFLLSIILSSRLNFGFFVIYDIIYLIIFLFHFSMFPLTKRRFILTLLQV